MRTRPLLYGVVFLMLMTTACAAGANELTGVPTPRAWSLGSGEVFGTG